MRYSSTQCHICSLAIAITLLTSAVMPSMPVYAQQPSTNPTVEAHPDNGGWVNWDKQVIKATGHGVIPGDVEEPAQARLMARAAAIADAYRNLAMVTNGVRVSGSTCVRNFVTTSDIVRMKVEGFIKGAHVVSEKQLYDRSYEIVIEVSMVGKDGLISGLESQIFPNDIDAQTQTDGSVTSLIVDARGLGVSPAISPRIYDEDGKEVYGTLDVSPDYAIQVGVAGYPRSIGQARKSARAGSHPMLVKALARGSKLATDVVISNADAARVRKANSRTNILNRCRVLIVTGP